MTVLDRHRFDLGTVDEELGATVYGGEPHPLLSRSTPPAPRVRISLKRLASGEWQPDYSVESFDADPATDDGYGLIVRRLEDTDSLIRERIALFLKRDAGTLDPGEEDLRD